MVLVVDHELAAAFGDRLAPFADLRVVRCTADVAQVDPTGVRALVIRTEQRVDAHLVARFPDLEVIVTASAGRDHVAEVDVPVLDARGGNADGVADWTVLALLAQVGMAGPRPTVGVLGCGAVGGRVLDRLAALGFPTVAVDPPRARRAPGFVSAPVEALYDCEVLSLHVPLTRAGEADATEGWLDAERLACWRRPFHLLSAARGEVIDEDALLAALRDGRVRSFRADVYRREPEPRADVTAAALLATPHVAGRSDDGRLGLQVRALQALCGHFGWSIDLPSELAPQVVLPPPAPEALLAWLDGLTGFGALDAALRASPERFCALRAGHSRRDLRRLCVRGGTPAVREAVRALGLGVA